jgi:prepilin-type processing-associated H-X9-DG protein/prepilin-type N-terminal cleavage/methylation domain-containing protein
MAPIVRSSRGGDPLSPENRLMRGFTLLELMVVITVLGMLLALLLPAISQSKKAAQQTYCFGNLHQIGLALQSFVLDSHEYPTGFGATNSSVPGPWDVQLEKAGFGNSRIKAALLSDGVWRCPSARWSTKFRPNITPASYGYNGFGILPPGNYADGLGLSGHFIASSKSLAPVRESEVIAPQDMMAIGESFTGGVYFVRDPLDRLEKLGYASSRHNGKVNVAFCDGHVESCALKNVFVDTSDEALARWNLDHQPHAH